jgi:hypothetical protein
MVIERDLVLAFMKLHLLHHAAQAPILGLEMIREFTHHGYELSLGTLYPSSTAWLTRATSSYPPR